MSGRKIEAGKNYVTKNGKSWTCVGVSDTHAWMRLASHETCTAYVWKLDGTNVSQGTGDYDVVWPPEFERVKVMTADMKIWLMDAVIDRVDGQYIWSSLRHCRGDDDEVKYNEH